MKANSESYPKELRWWFETWKPKHGENCSGRECAAPLIVLVKSELKGEKGRRYGFDPRDHYDWAISRVGAILRLLREYELAHDCFGGSNGAHVYMIGSAKDCKHPNHQA